MSYYVMNNGMYKSSSIYDPLIIVNGLLCHLSFHFLWFSFTNKYVLKKNSRFFTNQYAYLFSRLWINIFRSRMKKLITHSVKKKKSRAQILFHVHVAYTKTTFKCFSQKSDCVGKYVPFTSKSFIANRYNNLLSNKSGTDRVFSLSLYTFCNDSSHSVFFLRQQDKKIPCGLIMVLLDSLS